MAKTYARIFQRGDVDTIGIKVKSTGPAFTGSLPTFELRDCSEGYEVVIPETPANLITVSPKEATVDYILDTSSLEKEEYVVVLGLTINGGPRKRHRKLHIRVEHNPCD